MSDTGTVPYTLTMGLLWFALAFLTGLVTGVLLRSVTARRQLAAARDGAETRRLQRRIDELEMLVGTTQAQAPDDTSSGAAADRTPDPPESSPAEQRSAMPAPGPSDDLTVIDGLGPAVQELFEGVGILTFEALAATDVTALRSMLDDAGARSRVHDPSSWPEQARLLAEGRDEEFRALVETLRRGGPSASDG